MSDGQAQNSVISAGNASLWFIFGYGSNTSSGLCDGRSLFYDLCRLTLPSKIDHCFLDFLSCSFPWHCQLATIMEGSILCWQCTNRLITSLSFISLQISLSQFHQDEGERCFSFTLYSSCLQKWQSISCYTSGWGWPIHLLLGFYLITILIVDSSDGGWVLFGPPPS